MNKIILCALAVTFALPLISRAETTHQIFINSTPSVYVDMTGTSPTQRPFGLECYAGGFTKNKITWVSSVLQDQVKSAYSTVRTNQYEYRLPVFNDLTTFWYGSDVSTTTEIATNVLDVKYAKTGTKTLWFGATDGKITELVNCGTNYINLDAPIAKTIMRLDNGVELGY